MATERTVGDLTSDQAIEAVRESVEFVKATHDYGTTTGNLTVVLANGFRQKADLSGASAIQITIPNLSNRVNRILLYLDVSAYTGTLTFSGVDNWVDGNDGQAPDYTGRTKIVLLFVWDDDTSLVFGMDLGVSVTSAPINAQTGTTYTLVLADAGHIVEMSNASANTLTVPPNSSVAFKIGTIIHLAQLGAGQTTIAQGSGVTIRSEGSNLKLNAQYAQASLYKRATNEWVLAGSLTS